MSVKFENQTILITANEPWGDVWFSKHNYAWELSKKNKVFFINSPKKWRLKNLFSNSITTQKIHNTLTVVNINNYLPSGLTILKEVNNFINSFRLKRFVKKHSESFILWSFTPLVFFRPKLLGCNLSIFHVVDMHWPKFYGTTILAKNADILILISKEILFEYDHIQKPKLLVPHGISIDVFSLENNALGKVKAELQPYTNFGLFVGSIDDRLNFELIEKFAQKLSNTIFLFIGPIKLEQFKNQEELFKGKYSNIISLGARPYLDVKYYIHLAKFCVSPMNMNYPGNHISHHKTTPYLAQGKPIFSPYFKGYIGMEEIMYMSNDDDKLIELLDNFLTCGEDLSLEKKRIDIAKQHTYENLIQKIEVFVNEK